MEEQGILVIQAQGAGPVTYAQRQHGRTEGPSSQREHIKKKEKKKKKTNSSSRSLGNKNSHKSKRKMRHLIWLTSQLR